MSLLIGPNVKDSSLVDVFSKNENNAAAMRVKCVCGNFLGSLGQFNPLEGAWKGCRIVKCEELKVLKVEDTVAFLQRMRRDPNEANKKGCGRIIIFSSIGQVVKITVPGTEEHTKLAGALEKIRTDKDQKILLAATVKKQQAAMDAWLKK